MEWKSSFVSRIPVDTFFSISNKNKTLIVFAHTSFTIITCIIREREREKEFLFLFEMFWVLIIKLTFTDSALALEKPQVELVRRFPEKII